VEYLGKSMAICFSTAGGGDVLAKKEKSERVREGGVLGT
jgi:hypothetical protein